MHKNLHQLINFMVTLHRQNTFWLFVPQLLYDLIKSKQTVTSRLRTGLDRDLTARWLKPKIETC